MVDIDNHVDIDHTQIDNPYWIFDAVSIYSWYPFTTTEFTIRAYFFSFLADCIRLKIRYF